MAKLLTTKQHDALWTAVSKLESQVCRNPDLPPVYKQIVSDAFEVLREVGHTVGPAIVRECQNEPLTRASSSTQGSGKHE